jgi:ribonucleotide reductase alpha subunit
MRKASWGKKKVVIKLGLSWNYEECKRFLDILMMWSNRIHFSRSVEMGMDALLLSGLMEVWITKSFISPYKYS